MFGLGLHRHCSGNIIFDPVINTLPGNRQQNLKGAWDFFRAIRQTQHGKWLSHFTLFLFCNMKKIFKTYPCLLAQLCQIQLLLIASNACLQKQKPFDRTAERRLYLLNSASAERVSHVTNAFSSSQANVPDHSS